MALKGLDIFKLTPKTNCKDCGCPTCMAFSMKAAQGTLEINKCPHLSNEAKKVLNEATEPPMKTISLGAGDCLHSLGGETVLYRHDKTFVSKTLYGVNITAANADQELAYLQKIEYERIGERMYIELVNVEYSGEIGTFLETVKKALSVNRTLVLSVSDPDAAEAALEISGSYKPLLNGADETNYASMSALAVKFGVVLGVSGKSFEGLHATVREIEALGNKNLVLAVSSASVKDAFEQTVQIRRGALKDGDRSLGYPSLVNLAGLAPGDSYMQTALASLFTAKYGSIVILENMSYAQALPLFGLRQNIFTDPQRPMKIEPGIYPINGADESALCAVTVDFALTYFVVSGEMERSGVPVNLLISDAGGYSVLTAWAAGKFSAGSIAKFIKENNIENKINNRILLIPGKVAVIKGELQDNLPGWKIVVAPGDAVGLVRFLKEMSE